MNPPAKPRQNASGFPNNPAASRDARFLVAPAEASSNDDVTKPPAHPLPEWAQRLARAWNSNVHSLFILHGNIFDIFPVRTGDSLQYAGLASFLRLRLFPQRVFFMTYDIADGLTFATPAARQNFYEWLEIYDKVEGTNYSHHGAPTDFLELAKLLRRFFLHLADAPHSLRGVTLLIQYPEKIIPAADEAFAAPRERAAVVSLLKWASAPEFRHADIGVFLITESASELQSDLLQSPHVSQIEIPLPEIQQRQEYLENTWRSSPPNRTGDLSANELAKITSGLNLLRIQQLLAMARERNAPLDHGSVTAAKKNLIEQYCQGLVRFKEPKPHLNLDRIAGHAPAKRKFKELARLIKTEKRHVLERGVLVPGRVGVGKSFLIECFASECGLPVLEIGEFRSKWVGETERQLNRILMTIGALGPVVVVIDEADAVLGGRTGGDDHGVSNRVFAAFAAHIGDSSLRGNELWIALTSRPDLLAIDMKRQGRFGLCVPLFASQDQEDLLELFRVIGKFKGIELDESSWRTVAGALPNSTLTGSEIESILARAMETAALNDSTSVEERHLIEAARCFIDPLDPNLIALQELAAVLACSDKRLLPSKFADADRSELAVRFNHLRQLCSR